VDTIKRFVTFFMSAISHCTLYSEEHVAIDELAEKVLLLLNELFEDTSAFELMIIDNDLIANKTPLRNNGIHGNNLLKRFKRKGISRVEFIKGVTVSELKQFISDISSLEKVVKPYPHIKSGIVEVLLRGVQVDADFDLDGLSNFAFEQAEKVKDVYHGITPFKKLNVAGLEEIVINFILTFRQEANILKLICPIKTYNEYTYTHATNVSVLSIWQADMLGVTDNILHDVGIAALLHDVGKLFISKDILEKKGKLDDREWEEIRKHSLYGAKYLAKIKGIPDLAPIVAYQHHMKYDGTGYPETRVNGKFQHICSQTIAISDYFDALRSQRPYRRALEINEIMPIMHEQSGSFNPLLLSNFTHAVNGALSQ